MTEPNGVEATSGELATEPRAGLADAGAWAELQILNRHQAERIRHLEQALDESLLSLREARSQLLDQNFLESHLAATEETANVQQQAILNLKQQLAKLQQQPLAEQSAAEQPPGETRLASPSPLSEDVPGAGALEPERSQLQTVFSAQQRRVAFLEAESLSSRVFAASLGVWLHQALTELHELTQQLTDPPALFHSLELRLQQVLQQTQSTLQRQPRFLTLETEIAETEISSLETLGDGSSDFDRPTQTQWAIAQSKLEDLEVEMARQINMQTLLQHANRELEQEREQQQARVAGLERKTADLQEQILQQAQQASEYQTAVQHWKDRYESHRSQVQRLSDLLAANPLQRSKEISEILASLLESPEASVEPGSPELFVSSAQNQSTKLDLPDFLMRRRSYKTRRTS